MALRPPPPTRLYFGTGPPPVSELAIDILLGHWAPALPEDRRREAAAWLRTAIESFNRQVASRDWITGDHITAAAQALASQTVTPPVAMAHAANHDADLPFRTRWIGLGLHSELAVLIPLAFRHVLYGDERHIPVSYSGWSPSGSPNETPDLPGTLTNLSITPTAPLTERLNAAAAIFNPWSLNGLNADPWVDQYGPLVSPHQHQELSPEVASAARRAAEDLRRWHLEVERGAMMEPFVDESGGLTPRGQEQAAQPTPPRDGPPGETAEERAAREAAREFMSERARAAGRIARALARQNGREHPSLMDSVAALLSIDRCEVDRYNNPRLIGGRPNPFFNRDPATFSDQEREAYGELVRRALSNDRRPLSLEVEEDRHVAEESLRRQHDAAAGRPRNPFDLRGGRRLLPSESEEALRRYARELDGELDMTPPTPRNTSTAEPWADYERMTREEGERRLRALQAQRERDRREREERERRDRELAEDEAQHLWGGRIDPELPPVERNDLISGLPSGRRYAALLSTVTPAPSVTVAAPAPPAGADQQKPDTANQAPTATLASANTTTMPPAPAMSA